MKRLAEESVEDLEKRAKSGAIEQEVDDAPELKTGKEPELNQEGDNAPRLPPKCRIAMIVGYNGSDFQGSQKNPNIRSVEGEIEQCLFDMGVINKLNFGDLKKIGWGRATRTDKSVHALQNTFSCKVHLRAEQRADAGLEKFREDLNRHLKERTDKWQPTEDKKQIGGQQKMKRVLMKHGEIKVFCVIEVSNRFNAKNCTSHREYSYYLPTFLLAPISEIYLGKLGTRLKPEEQAGLRQEDITAQKVVNGITITTRYTNEHDARDGIEGFMNRDISHLLANPQFVHKVYGYRLPEDRKELVHKTFRDTFEGTKKYHNYTKDLEPSKEAAKRYMLELRANDYMYVNSKDFSMTNAEDPDALEFVHFYLRGQSFLYNQIRKMVGAMIQHFHGDLNDSPFLENTFKDNGVLVALSPGDGLMLEKVAYDSYNQFNTAKKADIMINTVKQQDEVLEYRKDIVAHIAARELQGRAYLNWLSYFDDNAAEFYVKVPSLEQIAQIRGDGWQNLPTPPASPKAQSEKADEEKKE